MDAISYLTAECNYGGRITDQFDRRLINVIFNKYLYNNSPDSKYYMDNFTSYESCLDFIINLPASASCEDFGLQSNASVSRNYYESQALLDGILLTLPRQVIIK